MGNLIHLRARDVTKNKKGISGVIAVVVLIAIVFALIGVVWTVVLPIVNDNLKRAGDCSPDILDKIELNRENTCYDKRSDILTDGIIKVSISIKDVDYDEIIVSATQESTTKSFSITSDKQDKNSGVTHLIKMIDDFKFSEDVPRPKSIKLMPVINGTQCQIVDSISNIKDC